MALLSIALPPVLKNEGGYVNNPKDPGGETYRGISRKNNPSWAGWAIIDRYKNSRTLKTDDVIKDAQLDSLVQQEYESKYWKPFKGDTIQNQDVANIYFDMHVNSGAAVKLMQKTLNSLGNKVTITNKNDADTITAINTPDAP